MEESRREIGDNVLARQGDTGDVGNLRGILHAKCRIESWSAYCGVFAEGNAKRRARFGVDGWVDIGDASNRGRIWTRRHRIAVGSNGVVGKAIL